MKRKIIKADVLGYCMGVRRAMETAEVCLDQNQNTQIYTFGPLIHNKIALLPLEQKGLQILTEDTIPQIDEKNAPIVIIRAHGISPATKQKLISKKCKIIDATCPLVLANQKKAASFAKDGYTVVLAGDKNHGEVSGIEGFAEHERAGSCIVVENAFDAQKIDFLPEKTILLCQTTFSVSEFERIANVLQQKQPKIQVFKTICAATNERQKALTELCKKVDGIVVIGGKNSANAQRLFATAKESGKPVCFIEKADELADYFFELEKIGITAGASTPDFVIAEVEKVLGGLAGEFYTSGQDTFHLKH